MADPKFANLPGIAYDQPDIYETPDVPEAETSDYYEEEASNESIEKLHISTKDSYNKFKGKYLAGKVDFSDRLGRKFHKGYESWTNEYELVGEGEKENPLQKCRRIQCEINELMDEISACQENREISKEDQESYEAVVSVVNMAKKILESLRLEQVLGKEEVSSTNAEKDVKALINQVEEYKKTGVLSVLQTTSDLAQSSRVAALEHRLHQLEKAVGAREAKLERLTSSMGTSNLFETVQQLNTRAALLQPSQVDLIEERLKNIKTKMDAIVEKTNASAQEAQRDQKVLELYEIAKRTEPIAQILPEMLERMQTLESLHKYATNFTKIIAELEVSQVAISSGLSSNKTLLQGVQEAFAQNLENVNKEVAKLEKRIATLEGKK